MNRVARVLATCVLSGAIIGILACDRKSREIGGVGPVVGSPQTETALPVVAPRAQASIESIAAGGPVKVDGAAVFARVCAACHQAVGQGIPGVFPPLDGSSYVVGDPERLLSIMMYGLNGPINVNGTTYNNVMAPVDAQLTDEETVAVANFVRTAWSNKGEQNVTAETLAAVRAMHGTRGVFTISELGEDK